MNSRQKAFFDDPAAYPEYSLLIKRESLHHAFRIGLHKHRTAALFLLIAVSTAASGAEMPSLFRNATPGVSGDGAGLAAEWGSYLSKGMALDLLARHFDGFVSAIGCTLAVTLLSLLVYPLHSWVLPHPSTTTATDGATRLRNASRSFWPSATPAAAVAAVTIPVAVPSALIWAVAAWGAGRFHWGVASGVCVGLQSAGLTLKAWSFVHKCCPAAVDRDTVVAIGSCGVSSSPRAASSNPNGGNERPAGGGKASAASPSSRDRCDGTTTSSAPPTPRRSDYNRASHLEDAALTFEEFAFFVVLAPSLVCEPRLLKRSARLPVGALNVAKAASEFFHAGLTYLAVHVYSTALFAPTLRVLAVALHSSWDDGQMWMDVREWAALGAAEGSGDWLLRLFRPATAVAAAAGNAGDFFASFAVEGDSGEHQQRAAVWAVIVVATCIAAFVFAPMMHFLMFYAFWHCVCLGTAELWGYPDRNIYGPWWLVMDDLRVYFRMWSAPVYRWLSATIQRPMLEAARTRRRAQHRCNQNDETRAADNDQWKLEDSTSGATTVSTGASKGEGGRRNCNDHNNGSNDHNNGRNDHNNSCAGVGLWFHASILCSFLVSSALHEAVGYIAMRRTFWPFNTFFLVLSASITPSWDIFFPALPEPTAAAVFDTVVVDGTTAAKSAVPSSVSGGHGKEQGIDAAALRSAGATDTGQTSITSNTAGSAKNRPKSDVGLASSAPNGVDMVGEGRDGGGGKSRGQKKPSLGVWRGWWAVAFFGIASSPATLAVDYLCWQWWRSSLMEK